MNSPIAALTWEIWRKGRRSAWLVLGCLGFCALVNATAPERFASFHAGQALYGLSMVLSFVFLMGIFNYTEFNSTREWNGFPYRLFALPVRTWQLVSVPMVLGVAAAELFYLAWIKLVWTHTKIVTPEWFAVALGAYVIFYQSTLWSLAGLRITRIVMLGLGGASGIAVACLPFFAEDNPSPWLSEKRLILLMAGMTVIAVLIAWAAVSRQRCGGGRRQSWFKNLIGRIMDALPRRAGNFASPAGAQFWFEWRRTGFVLPVCAAFVLIAIIGPVSWLFRADPDFTIGTLLKTLGMPLVLSFVIGKGFIKPEFWSLSLSLPPFLAVRPMESGEFVICKMKVAALSVAVSWVLVVAFIALWLAGWANTLQLKMWFYMFQQFHPHSWPMIVTLSFAGLSVLSWRFMVSGLWAGLSGKRSLYITSTSAQVIALLLALLVCGIWSDAIDAEIKNHPDEVKSVGLDVIGWVLALAAIAKLWFTVFSWRKITPRRTRQYLALWSGATLCFVALAILSPSPLDTYRLEHIFVLASLLLFPFARLGLAPLSFAMNRHR